MTCKERTVNYLSPPASVNMGDWWFDVATLNHFWIQRRFDVMRQVADSIIQRSTQVAEIGCGNGLLQRDIEDHYGISVSGFDLNEIALKKNVSRSGALYCYDIHQRNPELRARYDLLFLFDVLEHIEDESTFLQSVRFHLAKSGTLLINVPAHQSLYSDYDRAAGHIRRYSLKQLATVAERNGLKARVLTYWGLPLVPLVLLRKTMALPLNNAKNGFDTRGPAINRVLSWWARCESVPQKMLGTSIMAVFEN